MNTFNYGLLAQGICLPKFSQDGWENDTPLAQETLSVFESIRLLSTFAVTALPANPGPALLEKIFNQIYETCNALVILVDKAEAAQ